MAGGDILSREITEWIYGWAEGATKGSPAAVRGNRRERADDRERKKTGTVLGY
jgi:hypothetical protein